MWPHRFVQNWILNNFHHWSKSWNWVSEELNPVQVLALVLARIWQWMCPSSSNQLYLWVITYGEWCIWYIWSQETQNNPYIHVVEGRRCVSQGLAMWQVVTCIWLGVTLTEHWSPPLLLLTPDFTCAYTVRRHFHGLDYLKRNLARAPRKSARRANSSFISCFSLFRTISLTTLLAMWQPRQWTSNRPNTLL